MKQSTKNILKVNILLILAMLLTACGPSGTWDEHYDLGIKYLSDGNYKEAIIEFETAIKIDDMKPKAYIGAADAYVGMEEYQKAIEILETGYEKCEDEEIYKKLQSLRFEHDESGLAETFSEWGVEDLMTLDDVTLNGSPLDNMSWDTALKNVKSIYSARGEEYQIDITNEGKNGYGYASGVSINLTEGNGFPGLHISFSRDLDETYLGWKNIALGESAESVLKKIGFTDEGTEYLTYLLNNKREVDVSYLGGGKGECISIDIYSDLQNPVLRMTYMSSNSEKIGHIVNFTFQDGILQAASFTQNNVTISD